MDSHHKFLFTCWALPLNILSSLAMLALVFKCHFFENFLCLVPFCNGPGLQHRFDIRAPIWKVLLSSLPTLPSESVHCFSSPLFEDNKYMAWLRKNGDVTSSFMSTSEVKHKKRPGKNSPLGRMRVRAYYLFELIRAPWAKSLIHEIFKEFLLSDIRLSVQQFHTHQLTGKMYLQ